MRRWMILFLVLVVLAAIPLLMAASWVVTQSALDATSGEPFCGSCHVMAPLVAAYREDVHGGNNDQGLAARCTDCHVPHDSARNHLIGKVATSLHSGWGQVTYSIGLNKIDWQAKREDRARFVFDSGCLMCHAELDRDTNPHYPIHSLYFADPEAMACVTCHPKVGHHDLDSRLAPPTPSGS
ncbi:NapC/NirT family cytochrome c [Thioalkalicoccus limnaeus]|uniref:Cytochrome c-type protein n=1 Tax=Thioalkalicoccus limnaeus TaxID=120681 RepID=A0ABV4BE07_9GAMM